MNSASIMDSLWNDRTDRERSAYVGNLKYHFIDRTYHISQLGQCKQANEIKYRRRSQVKRLLKNLLTCGPNGMKNETIPEK